MNRVRVYRLNVLLHTQIQSFRRCCFEHGHQVFPSAGDPKQAGRADALARTAIRFSLRRCRRGFRASNAIGNALAKERGTDPREMVSVHNRDIIKKLIDGYVE